MRGNAFRRCEEGRRTGGPLLFATLAATLSVACAGGPSPARPGGATGPTLGRPLETYEQLGFIAGPSHFPVVASLATVAGPADSTYVLLALSIPSSALRFQRERDGFAAEYIVTATFAQDSQVVQRAERRDEVRVPTFAETSRTDESVVFQDAFLLEPGRYDVTIQARDANSSRGFRSRDTIDIPRYGPGAFQLAQPLLIYDGEGRVTRDRLPELILNPRSTVAYGGTDPRVYVESYGPPGEAITMRVTDALGEVVWSTVTSASNASSGLGFAMVDLPTTQLPAGRLWLEVEDADGGTAPERAPLVVSISDQWMVANFDEVIGFLSYIAFESEIDSLRAATTPEDQRARWEDFWRERDPLPATPINEFRDQFFQRVRTATEQFSEPGAIPGWKTDRGEVYIVLGPPDFARDGYLGGWNEEDGPPNALDWIYTDVPGGRLELLFLERSGFGHWELDPQSMVAFRAVAEGLRPGRR